MLDYQTMVKTALRGVLRETLETVAREGLRGSHQLYVSFRTDYPEVVLPSVLRDVYPHEMTIVLEHQFWDLEVEPELFAVTLSFGDVRHRLIVPFAAVTAFIDPGAQFGLQFDSAAEGLPAAAAAGDPEPAPAGEPDDEGPGSAGAGNVLHSDRFRLVAGEGDEGG